MSSQTENTVNQNSGALSTQSGGGIHDDELSNVDQRDRDPLEADEEETNEGCLKRRVKYFFNIYIK